MEILSNALRETLRCGSPGRLESLCGRRKGFQVWPLSAARGLTRAQAALDFDYDRSRSLLGPWRLSEGEAIEGRAIEHLVAGAGRSNTWARRSGRGRQAASWPTCASEGALSHPFRAVCFATSNPGSAALGGQCQGLRQLANRDLQRPGAHRPFHHLLLGAQRRRLAPRGRAERKIHLPIRFRVDKAPARTRAVAFVDARADARERREALAVLWGRDRA